MAGGGGGAEPHDSGPRRNVFGETGIQSVDLNLTALMDILSNLLFFLLASFGATIVVAINAAVPVQSADKSDVADTQQSVTVNVKMTSAGYEVAAMGTAQTDAELAPFNRVLAKTQGKDGEDFDYAGLASHLMKVKEAYPRSDTLILTPDGGLRYEALVQTMDAAREVPIPAQPGRTLKLFPSVVVSTVVK